MPWKHALRDLLVLLATLALWRVDAALRGGPGPGPALVAVAAGAGAALCGYLVHEWGHLLGARLAGAVVHLPTRARDHFLFRFDVARNDRRAFLAMSVGGLGASLVAVAALLAVLPLGALSGQVALGLVAAGVLATFVLELPVAWRVARGGPLPQEGAAYRGGAADGCAAAPASDGSPVRS